MKTDEEITRLTVSSPKLAMMQKRHAVIMNLIPAVGTVLLLPWCLYQGISPPDLILLIIMYLLNFIGVEIGFHRHFSHSAFKAKNGVRQGLAILGCMAGQGPVSYWVANHRRHHIYEDTTNDPHSPYLSLKGELSFWRGLWHAHVGWLFENEITNPTKFAKDSLRDSVISKTMQYYFFWVFLGFLIPGILGGLFYWEWRGAISGILWGGALRMFLVQHVTFSINSICHRFGSRRFEVTGRSRNNLWLALPSLGGSWHNNHHAYPYSAIVGLKWWEIDVGAFFIKLAEKAGWVWDVKRPRF